MADIEARFWSRVDRRGPDECWPWQGCVHKAGYGHFRINRQRVAYASRYAWESTHGPAPAGQQVCHSCDNRLCVNPGHLWLGTLDDNMADRNAKGRQARGERSWSARLTEDAVLYLRRVKPTGSALKTFADKWGVAPITAQQAMYGVTWRHLPMGNANG